MNAQASLLIPTFSANYVFMASEFKSKLYKALCMSNQTLDMKAFAIHRYPGNLESVGALLLY